MGKSPSCCFISEKVKVKAEKFTCHPAASLLWARIRSEPSQSHYTEAVYSFQGAGGMSMCSNQYEFQTTDIMTHLVFTVAWSATLSVIHTVQGYRT